MPEIKPKTKPHDCRTITLSIAAKAVQAYNTDCLYAANNGLDLDRRACELFRNGLAHRREHILEQVHFIGKDYGGVAGFPAALSLAPAITDDILARTDRYSHLVKSALPLRQAPSCVSVISKLFAPFVRPLHRKKNWQTWAVKFWHLLNPDAFPIEDSRVDKFSG